MRMQTTGTITGNDVTDLERSPHIVDGALKICFETGASKAGVLGIEAEHPDETSNTAWTALRHGAGRRPH